MSDSSSHRFLKNKNDVTSGLNSNVQKNNQAQKYEPESKEGSLERRKMFYARFGYDVEKERLTVIKAAQPFSPPILDAGTGKGYFALALARLGYNLVSFDLSEEQLQFARQNLEKQGLIHLVELRQEDGEKLSFPDGSFNTIFSVNMIHHLKNAYGVLNELIRVLSSEGKLVICDFSSEGMAMMAEVHRLEGDEHEESSVTLAEVEKFLRANNFSLKKSRTRYEITIVAQRQSR
jgi:ubiquinone/menaquinone biosynthesis C-methylase UbiE